jgi:hypothetical protein
MLHVGVCVEEIQASEHVGWKSITLSSSLTKTYNTLSTIGSKWKERSFCSYCCGITEKLVPFPCLLCSQAPEAWSVTLRCRINIKK